MDHNLLERKKKKTKKQFSQNQRKFDLVFQ